jgi:hypothetical protein
MSDLELIISAFRVFEWRSCQRITERLGFSLVSDFSVWFIFRSTISNDTFYSSLICNSKMSFLMSYSLLNLHLINLVGMRGPAMISACGAWPPSIIVRSLPCPPTRTCTLPPFNPPFHPFFSFYRLFRSFSPAFSFFLS